MKLKTKINKICGVYKITNPKGECYIGQSFDIIKRFENHKKYLSSNAHLSLSLKKYGAENHTFEILEECIPVNLYERENYYISIYKESNILFNFTIPKKLGGQKVLIKKKRKPREKTSKEEIIFNNPIKQVIELGKSSQKEVCEKLDIKQSTLSARMIKDVKGSIEWSIDVAKELNVNKYTIVGDGYSVVVKVK